MIASGALVGPLVRPGARTACGARAAGRAATPILLPAARVARVAVAVVRVRAVVVVGRRVRGGSAGRREVGVVGLLEVRLAVPVLEARVTPLVNALPVGLREPLAHLQRAPGHDVRLGEHRLVHRVVVFERHEAEAAKLSRTRRLA